MVRFETEHSFCPWLRPCGLILFCASVAAQSQKISGPLALSPAANGGRVLDARIAGDRAVYRADQDSADVLELYSVPLDGSQAAAKLNGTLPMDGDVTSFLVSPDGSRVLYVADQDVNDVLNLYSVPSDAGASPILLGGPVTGTPKITPDGSRALYFQDSFSGGELMVVPVDGSAAPVLLAQSVSSFEISPDGSRALYLVSDFGPNCFCVITELYSVPLDGSQAPVKLNGILPTGFNAQIGVDSFRISPDGERVVYRANQDDLQFRELYGVPIDGSAAAVKLSGPLVMNGAIGAFEISPDGTRAVYLADQDTDEVFELYSAPVEGGQPPVKVSGHLVTGGDVAGFGAGPAFQITPDGQRVVYRADREQNEVFRLYVVPIDGSSGPVRSTPDAAREFQVDAQGLRVVYLAPLSPTVAQLWSAPLDRTPSLRHANGTALSSHRVRLSGPLVPGGTVLGFQISPDARRVVYHADQETDGVIELFSAPIAGGESPVKLSGPLAPGGDVGGILPPPYQISPDASRVVYHADQETDEIRELFSVPIDRGLEPVKLNGMLDPGPPAGDVYLFQLSPDGARFVYLADGDSDEVFELYGGPVDGSQPIEKLNGPLVANGDVGGSRISLDGSRVVYIADQDVDEQRELYSAPADGSSSPVKLNGSLGAGTDVGDFQLSPDGLRVVFAVQLSLGRDLYSVPVGGGASPVRLNGSVLAAVFQISPDGTRVVFPSSGFPRELYSAPTDGSQAPVKLNGALVAGGNVQSIYAPEFSISPSGERVVYVADQDVDERFELYSAPIDGSAAPVKLNRALAPGDDVYQFKISPAGNRVVHRVFRAAAYQVELYSAPIDGAPPLRRAGGSEVRGRVKLNGPIVGMAGKFPTGVWDFAISPDGARVAFILVVGEVRSELHGVPIDGSEDALRLSDGSPSGVGAFAFSPDGQRVVFQQRTDNTRQLYSVPSDGSQGPIRLDGPLVAGGNVESSGKLFEISPDSRRVVYRADQEVDERFELYATAIDGTQSPVKLNGILTAGGDVGGTFGTHVPPTFAISPDGTRVVYAGDQDSDEVFELYRSPLP